MQFLITVELPLMQQSKNVTADAVGKATAFGGVELGLNFRWKPFILVMDPKSF